MTTNIPDHKLGLSRAVLLFFSISAFFLFSMAPTHTAVAAQEGPQRVAILPFTMHTPSDLHYLQDGIRDMLASRLAQQGKVQVMDRSATLQAARSIQGDMNEERALRVGQNLKADHVIFGSVTALGQSISIDSTMISVSAQREPLSLTAQTQTMDEVIPEINQFAQRINDQVFGRAAPVPQAADREESRPSLRHPEHLFADIASRGDRTSYLNPNFLEMASEGTLRQPGLWRSQTFQGGILGMDAGDVTGDGETELVTVTRNRITVFKKQAQGLRQIASYSGTTVDRFLWVALADTNLDGRSEIYVTNLRRFNQPGGANYESVQGSRGYTERLASMGLTMENGQLETLISGAPYFLNVVEIPGRGRVLIGQEKGLETEGPFAGRVTEMRLSGGSLSPSSPLNLPARCNVFNFAMGDINNDGSNEIIFIDDSNTLNIVSATGQRLWKSDRVFASTTNMFEGRVRDRRYNYVDMYAIPSPILVTDINGDGIAEIVVNRSPNVMARFLPDNLKYYDKSEIVSLSWDQLGLVENWKTREISGMVTSIRLADLDGTGEPQLVSSLVLARDFLKIWQESQSTIFSYDLNLKARTARADQ